MASRWFIFWMSLFVISFVRESAFWPIVLFFAYICDDPQEEMQSKTYLDTKRIVHQYFAHYFGKREG